MHRTNIEALYEALRTVKPGAPLVEITKALSDKNQPHLIIKRRSRTTLPQWRRLDAKVKELLRQFAMHKTGNATAFNLNLGTGLAGAHTYGSTASRNALRDRLARALRDEFKRDVPFTTVLEVDAGGRLHLHGTVGIGVLERPRLSRSLRRAGGEWGHKFGRDKQVKLDDLYGPKGWHTYITKLLTAKNPFPPGHLITKSRSADQMAMALYDDMLAFIRENKEQIDPVRVGYMTGDEDALDGLFG